jgi:membrane protease YdiL (CAAX protease family)
MNIADTWRPRDAWLFVALAVGYCVVFAIIEFATLIIFPSLRHLLHAPIVSALLFIFNLAVMCALSLFLARVRTTREFVVAFGFTRPKEREILGAVAIGVLFQLAWINFLGSGLSHIELDRSFQVSSVVVLLGPLFEELAIRGFIYRAFRNSYSVAASVLFVVLISAVFHTQYYQSALKMGGIAMLNLILCLIKERHSTTWSCIACHFVFNATYASIDQHYFR